tara:strand:- start:16 stop:366 length:351 start_codon:yes stop_codon:yes gene_type:complete
MILTTEQLNVLNHIVVDGQGWADHANLEKHMLAKVAKYQASYDAAVAKGNYKTRKQIVDAEEQAEKDAKANAPYNVKRGKAYPSLPDQLDALWKGGDDAAAMKVIIDKVKSDNPKG